MSVILVSQPAFARIAQGILKCAFCSEGTAWLNPTATINFKMPDMNPTIEVYTFVRRLISLNELSFTIRYKQEFIGLLQHDMNLGPTPGEVLKPLHVLKSCLILFENIDIPPTGEFSKQDHQDLDLLHSFTEDLMRAIIIHSPEYDALVAH